MFIVGGIVIIALIAIGGALCGRHDPLHELEEARLVGVAEACDVGRSSGARTTGTGGR